MKQQPTARMPRSAIAILALSLIALVLLAGHSESGPPPAAAQNQLVWVRQDPPVINFRDDPTFWECPEGVHCEGSFWDYIIDETEIFKEERYVNNGLEHYHITLESVFDRPPQVMNPGSRYQVRATFSHSKVSGTPTYRECLYFQYFDESRPWLAEPPWEYAYCPWNEKFDGTASATWMLDPGWPFKEGDTFEVRAAWVGAFDDPANVTWTYRAEQNAPGEEARLGVEVVAPVVEYMDEEVPVGEVFFPETCSDGRAAETCAHVIRLIENGRLDCQCFSELESRLLLLLQLVDFSKDEDENAAMKIAIAHLATIKIAENCTLPRSATSDYELGLVLEQGALLLNNVLDGQTVEVNTPAGSAGTVKVGGFLTAYNPATNTATFQSHGAPLTVRPETGPPLELQPRQQVEVTAAGAGPVTDLPHLFLPLQIR